MGCKVFICYRHDDTQDVTTLLAGMLVREFGAEAIFVDMNSIAGGDVFPQRIQKALKQARVVLAMIGPKWLALSNEYAQRRIDDPEDWVRVEISSALSDNSVQVIPVLVDGAKLPPAMALPVELRPMTERQIMPLANGSFESDARKIADRIASLGVPRLEVARERSRNFPSHATSSLPATGSVTRAPSTPREETSLPAKRRRLILYGAAPVALMLIALVVGVLSRVPSGAASKRKSATSLATTTAEPATRSTSKASSTDLVAPDLASAQLSATRAGAGQVSNHLRVATWNLAWLHPTAGNGPVPRSDADYERLQRYALRLDADIVAVQEVHSEDALSKVFPKESYRYHLSQLRLGQRTGFVYRSDLAVTAYADFSALNPDGHLRSGADVSVRLGAAELRLLSVHLKAGCATGAIDSSQDACVTLNTQLSQLTQWANARLSEGTAFAIVGDFNHQFFNGKREAWLKLNPARSHNSLWSPTESLKDQCWRRFKPFVDHLILDSRAKALAVDGSFSELVFDPQDEAHREQLSDHCPISIELRADQQKLADTSVASPSGPAVVGSPSGPAAVRSPSAGAVTPRLALAQPASPKPKLPIKGNINAGNKVYHLPDCPDYDRVRIDKKDGERYFDSETAAQAAGWKKSGNCR